MTDEPTVLLVDDEADVVEVYALALRESCEVRRAHGGAEALEELDESVDVVLLDRRMPELSGREVLAEMRDREADVRVALVTAVDPDFDVVEMPFDAYLVKPVTDAELRETVAELHALRRYDGRVAERFAVAEKMATLEAEKSSWELDESDEYARLVSRAAELDAEMDAAATDLDAAGFRKLLADLDGGDGEA
jgi:CheY-like chemotaxis protein